MAPSVSLRELLDIGLGRQHLVLEDVKRFFPRFGEAQKQGWPTQTAASSGAGTDTILNDSYSDEEELYDDDELKRCLGGLASSSLRAPEREEDDTSTTIYSTGTSARMNRQIRFCQKLNQGSRGRKLRGKRR